MDNLAKALTLLFIAAGFAIFVLVLLFKLDVVSKKAEAEVQESSSEAIWEAHLYHQAIEGAMKAK